MGVYLQDHEAALAASTVRAVLALNHDHPGTLEAGTPEVLRQLLSRLDPVPRGGQRPLSPDRFRDTFTSTVDGAAGYERGREEVRPTYISGQSHDPDDVPSRAEIGPDD